MAAVWSVRPRTWFKCYSVWYGTYISLGQANVPSLPASSRPKSCPPSARSSFSRVLQNRLLHDVENRIALAEVQKAVRNIKFADTRSQCMFLTMQ
jgi:hypothetical protein